MQQETKRWDLLTIGEAMIRLTPPSNQRLEQAESLRIYVGGCEANVAVGVSRLGMRAAWMGRLPRGPLGQRVVGELAAVGVDTTTTIWADQGRVGVYYLEVAGAPRGSRVVYDRADSAASQLSPDDIDWGVLDHTRHLHLSGITVALSASCASVVQRALEEARRRGVSTSFDLNYRSKLWSPEEARVALEPLLDVDLLFCTRDDAVLIFGLSGEPRDTVEHLRRRSGARLVALTLGGDGAIASSGDRTWVGRSFKVDTVDRVGAGDAYAAGFLVGFLLGDIDRAVAFGGAMAAWKHSEPGDFCYAERADIERLLANEGWEIRR